MFSIAIFGGTFDPVHYGHLKTSINIQKHFKFDLFCFVPCKIPVIKAPSQATPEQRVQMLELALQDYPQFKIDTREIDRSSASYMVDTLKSFRTEHPKSAITLILGYDSFLSLTKWHQWERLTSLANLLVINREEYSNEKIPTPLQMLMTEHKGDNHTTLVHSESGVIQFFDAGHYELSSTKIREQIKKYNDLSDVMPIQVYEYIKKHELYQ